MTKTARFAALVLALIVVLAAALPALAQGPIIIQPPAPQHSDPSWQAWYWRNASFTGSPALQRSEAAINYDWGTGSPDPSLPADLFSARWTRYLDTAAGTYRFTATADDGIRVFVDNQAVINQWTDHSAQTFTGDIALAAGHHLVVVEYYENAGVAVAKVSWGPAPQPIYNWRGEYFNNPSLDGSPSLVRDDAAVNFNWGAGSPAPGVINADYFSARWTRTLDLPADNYQFNVTVDDGARLWVNGHLLIDTWQVQSPHTYSGQLYLPGGATQVKLEYYENNGGAVAQLSWARGGTNPPPPPVGGEVLVEDTGVGFSKGGSSTAWHTALEGSGGHLTWTRNNDYARPYYNWARWYPSYNGLKAGLYEVFVYIPERYTTTAAANYWISHAGGYTQRVVNQSAHGGQWVSLGTYNFRGDANDYVSLSDVTGEPYISQLIAFDAVKWVPR